MDEKSGNTVSSLDEVRAILTPSLALRRKATSRSFYDELDAEFGGFAGHTLISQFTWSEPWGVWEMHPKGDEFVYLQSGATDFLLRIEGVDQRHRLDQPGQYVIVPKGVWHTAEPLTPTTALFITPGEGTRNEREPVD